MSKYNLTFKLAVVKAYFAGKGSYRTIANDFGIPSHANVTKWVRIFEKSGVNGLKVKRNKEFYPVHFKIDVIQYRLRTGDTLQATALKYGINEPSTIANWIDVWDRKGIEGLSNKKEKP